jgi:hypothetical protein
MSEWIRFEHMGSSKSGKTSIFAVLTKESGVVLGRIAWHPPWRCYAFFPAADTVFERTCLQDIAKFVSALADTVGRGMHA